MRGAYDRYAYPDEKRHAWRSTRKYIANLIDAKPGNVTPLHSAAA
jgi:hypothetical protein